MNKRILLTFLIVLTVALSVGTIYASDVNVTDSCAANVEVDTAIENSADSMELSVSESDVDIDSSDDVLNSQDSSTLSTNTDESDVLAKSSSSKIDVSKTVTSKNVTKYYKGSEKYTATFLNSKGKALANTKVDITVNGKTYTRTTDANGTASLDINLKPGTYKVVAKNPSTGYALTTTFKVLSTISASDMSKVWTDKKKFSAKFLKKNGKALANKKVKFKIDGKTYTRKTNSKGIASLSLISLKKGTYKIISYNTDGLTKTNTVKVVRSTSSSLTASDYTFIKSDTKKIKVRMLNKFGYAPGEGKTIKFKVNGKTYTALTDKKGYATLKLPSLKEGVYTVKYNFEKTDFYSASSTKSTVTILPSKNVDFTVKSTTTFGQGAETALKVALTSGSVPIANKEITITISGTSYKKTTDSKGIASLPINLAVGKYTAKFSVDGDSKINAKSDSTEFSVVKRGSSSVTWKSSTSFSQGTQSCKFLVVDSKGKVISGATVKLTVNGKSYTAKTDKDGYATIKASFTSGEYKVSYSFAGDNLNAPSSGSTSLNVKKVSVTIKNIVKAATTLKTYYANNNKFPSTVTAGGIKFTLPEFLYLMSQAIYQLGNSKTTAIEYISGISAPSSPSGDSIHADLYKEDYLTVAKNAAKFIKNNKLAPNYATSTLGNIIYKELIDAETRILAFYGENNRLPNYVTITYGSGSSSSQSGSGLNQKCTIDDITPYLKKTTNCEVGNSAIAKKVKSLTSGLTSDAAKAKAIFNYVRDSISYSFYYDTRHGALGTYNAKSGNCVDQSHLLVAMFRTAGLAARYVHGTCTFSSGSTYGHVWTQVLIDGKWTVADATSSRNSLGNVANWNTKSYTLHGFYRSLTF